MIFLVLRAEPNPGYSRTSVLVEKNTYETEGEGPDFYFSPREVDLHTARIAGIVTVEGDTDELDLCYDYRLV